MHDTRNWKINESPREASKVQGNKQEIEEEELVNDRKHFTILFPWNEEIYLIDWAFWFSLDYKLRTFLSLFRLPQIRSHIEIVVLHKKIPLGLSQEGNRELEKLRVIANG
jgi:hypothetical protein